MLKQWTERIYKAIAGVCWFVLAVRTVVWMLQSAIGTDILIVIAFAVVIAGLAWFTAWCWKP